MPFTEIADVMTDGNTPREVVQRTLLDLEAGADFNYVDWRRCMCGRMYAATLGDDVADQVVSADDLIARPKGKAPRSAAYIEALWTVVEAHGGTRSISTGGGASAAATVSTVTRQLGGYGNVPSRYVAIRMMRTTLDFLDKRDAAREERARYLEAKQARYIDAIKVPEPELEPVG